MLNVVNPASGAVVGVPFDTYGMVAPTSATVTAAVQLPNGTPAGTVTPANPAPPPGAWKFTVSNLAAGQQYLLIVTATDVKAGTEQKILPFSTLGTPPPPPPPPGMA
jgi:hypothetical protein